MLRRLLTILPLLLALGCNSVGTFKEESSGDAASNLSSFEGVSSYDVTSAGKLVLNWEPPISANASSLQYEVYMQVKNDDVATVTAGALAVDSLQLAEESPGTLWTFEKDKVPSKSVKHLTTVSGINFYQVEEQIFPGRTYLFQVRAKSLSGESDLNQRVLVFRTKSIEEIIGDYSGCVSVVGQTPSSVKINFEFPLETEEVTILRDGEKIFSNRDHSVLSYTDWGLTSGREYAYRCQLVANGEVVRGETTIAQAQTPLEAIGVPFLGCSAGTAISTSSVKIDFDFRAVAESVKVYRNGIEVFVTNDSGVSSFVDTSLAEGVEYTYSCAAVVDGQTVLGSQKLPVATLTANAPTFGGILTATPDGADALITWAAASGVPVSYFKIWAVSRVDNGDPNNPTIDFANDTPLKTILAGSQSTSISSLGDELSYMFAVRACNTSDQCDANTAEVSLTFADRGAPLSPGATSVSIVDGVVQIAAPWQSSYGAVAKRRVYQRDGAGTYPINGFNYKIAKTVAVPSPYTTVSETMTITGLAPDTSYYFIVRDIDPSDNENQNISVVTLNTGDTTKPDFTGLTGVSVKAGFEDTSVVISFNGTTRESDGVTSGSSFYQLYQLTGAGDACATGTLVNEFSTDAYPAGAGHTYEKTGLTERTLYNFCLKSRDAANNISNTVADGDITTIDITPPQFDGVQGLSYDSATSNLTVSWNQSSSDDVNLYSVRIWKFPLVGPPAALATINRQPAASYTDGTDIHSSDYLLESSDDVFVVVNACDDGHLVTGGQLNCTTIIDSFAITMAIPDIAAPSNFNGIKSASTLTTPSEGSVEIFWNEPAADDWPEYRGFRVYHWDGSDLNILKDCPCVQADCSDNPTSCTLTGLSPYRTYSFHVRAYDTANNETQLDTSLYTSIKQTTDQTDPVFTSGMSSLFNAGSVDVNWSAASDAQYDGGATISYKLYRKADTTFGTSTSPSTDGTLLTTTPSLTYTDSNSIVDGKTYFYAICASDASSNEICDGHVSQITLDDITPPVVSNLATNKTAILKTWDLTWDVSDTIDTVLEVKVYYSISDAAELASPADDQLGSTIFSTGSLSMTGLTGPDDVVKYINYHVIAIDDGGNTHSADLSVLSDNEMTIANITRDNGSVDGGKLVMIEGKGFTSGATVSIGGADCEDVNVFYEGNVALPNMATQETGSMLLCTTTSNTAGAKDVTVTVGGSTAVSTGGYTYCDGGSCNICDRPTDWGASFAEGDGTVLTPYLICNVDHLENIASSKKHTLSDNIDLTTLSAPIATTSFTLKGENHILANFSYTSVATEHPGLFNGAFNGVTIENLGLINFHIDGDWNSRWGGTLAGYPNANTTFDNIFATQCSVIPTSGASSAGGLSGYNGNGNSYSDLRSDCTVTSTVVAAGVFAYMGYTPTKLERILSTGNITGGEYTGGIVGYMGGGNPVFIDSHATGDVSGTTKVGGFIGGFTGGNATYYNSSASGNVFGSGSYVGGFIGYGGRDQVCINSHASGDVEGSGYVGGFIASYTFSNTLSVFEFQNCYAKGNVTNHGTATGGFIGYIISAGKDVTIRNSFASGDVTSDSSSVGGFLGLSNTAVTTGNFYHQSFAVGSVSGTQYVGGFAGQHYFSAVQSAGTDLAFKQSYSTGNVTATHNTSYVGGFSGLDNSEIEDSYSRSSVTGVDYVGGFVGSYGYSTSCLGPNRSYHAGTISRNGAASYAGGFTGNTNLTYCTAFEDNFWDSSLSEANSHYEAAGEVEGKSTADMGAEATFTNANWDFGPSGVWVMGDDNYPMLRWQKEAWAAAYPSTACSGTNGSKTLRIFLMNHDQTTPMVIASSAITANDTGVVSNDQCSGVTLAAAGGSCEFTVTYASTPATSDTDIDVAVTGADFNDTKIASDEVDNGCP